MGDKSTKEILESVLDEKRKEGNSLYNPKALEVIQQSFEKWKNTVVSEKDRENWEMTPHTIIGSNIPRGLIYTPLDIADLDYEVDLGYSEGEPYTRGIHSNMYRGQTWTQRQLSGAGSPEYVNNRIKFLLDHGATGTNLALDLATVQMFDSDEPEADGMVATVGVPIDCVQDFESIYKDIPIDKVSSSIVTHYPRNTSIIFPMYLVMAEKRGYGWDKLPGSVQNDFIMENVVRSACEWIPPKDDFRVQCDNIEFLRNEVPKWNYVTLNGYNLREEGTSGVTEMAVALANGIAIMDDMLRRGYDPDWTAKRMAFFWAPANDFFEEVARIRAARRLWYRIMKHKYQAKDPRSCWMRCHVQTSGISLQRVEPFVNIVRAAYHALAAILGGAQSLHVDGYDEAYSVPGEESSLLGLRTQQLINAETQVTQVVDPLGGSFYVEALTDDIERRILDEIDEVEKLGGLPEAVAKGWLHHKVISYLLEEERMIEDGRIKVVARNYFRDPNVKEPPVVTQPYDSKIRDQMVDKLKKWRKERDNDKVKGCLEDIVRAGKEGKNITYYTVEAARAGATEGEMRRAFTESFGTWRPPVYA